MNRAVEDMQTTIFEHPTADPAALAIRQAVQTLVDCGVCSREEFISLIDLDSRQYWLFIAQEIADKLEPLFRTGEVHPNAVKPWQIDPSFQRAFKRIVDQRAWRSALGAINSILSAVNALYEEGHD